MKKNIFLLLAWILAGSSTAIVAPDPPPGEVLWYTVDAELDGITSAKGAAMSKTVPFPAPAGPVLRGVR